MKTIETKNGKWVIEKNKNGNYDCNYYEYYGSNNTYKLIAKDVNCSKDFIENEFEIEINF